MARVIEPKLVKQFQVKYLVEAVDEDSDEIVELYVDDYVYVYELVNNVYVVEVHMEELDEPGTYYVEGEVSKEVVKELVEKECRRTYSCKDIVEVEEVQLR